MAVIPPQDLLFLLMEAREKPAHVGGLALFEPPPDADEHYLYELYRSCVESEAPVRSLFRKRVNRPGLLGLQWVRDDDFDIEYHVRHSALPEPGRIRELLTVVSRLHGSLLDRNRPLWEAHLIEGLRDGRFALYSKIHHALCDGVTAMRLLEASMSPDPAERGMPQPWARRPRQGSPFDEPDPDDPDALAAEPAHGRERARPEPPEDDTWTALVSDGLRRLGTEVAHGVGGVLSATEGVGQLAASFRDQVAAAPQAPRTPFNVPVTGARRFAADSWSIDRVRAAGAPHGATVNDVVLGMSAGALRRYLLDQGALPDEPLVAMVPVSLKARGADDSTGNAVGAVLCSLGTHLDGAAARLEHIQESMHRNKDRLEGLTPAQILALSALNLAPAVLPMSPLARTPAAELLRPAFNVVISNVPGPKQPLYWNGARLTGNYPLSVLTDGQAVNITTASYAGSLDFGILGCRRAVPSLQRLLGYLEEELVELESA
ncbi:MAG TPA: wax ester/triacylglycerol synthase family O-acyltransferase [Acidimicrobiales bacterium]|nr:wax ester/triacylglycerol synthase family O-acyltransferase [Acidimicrobiales bacterium]